MYQNTLRAKSSFYILLVMLLVISTVYSVPVEKVSATGETTTFTIKSPAINSKINTTNVIISGAYTSDADQTDLLFTAEENDYHSDSSVNKSDWVIDDTNAIKTWTFSPQSLSEGTHIFDIKLKKISTNEEFSQTITFTIDKSIQAETPTILITSPATGAVFNSKNVTISGTYTADAPEYDLLFTAKDNGKKISDTLVKNGDWTIDNNIKTWSFTISTLEEGNHNFTVEIKNLQTNVLSEISTDFSLSFTRPYISETGIILANGKERKGEDLTNVPLDANLKITVVDDQPMNQLKSKIDSGNYNPIKILLGTDTLQGVTEINGPVTKDEKYYYEIIFNPNNAEIKMNKTYMVYINPEMVVDDLENPIFTRLFKFTTMTNAAWDDSENPHGHYQLNTNMCAACHSTHASKSPSLTGGSYQLTFTKQLTKDQPADDPSQNYCMACHDGTLNAPFTQLTDSKYRHNNPIDYDKSGKDALKQPEWCTSCHNPHLEWSQDNQNLLKDHYVYTHNEAHPEQGLDNPTVDSLDISCDSCHDYINFSTISSDKGKQEILAYKKSITATGKITNKLTNSTIQTISDYSLCLRCHNAEKSIKDPNKSDIETYYLQQQSGHNFVLTDAQQTQRDGSVLSGPIPCADCHETHGSINLFNLREILGNNPLVSNNDKFKTIGTTWDKDNERNFCLNCHNKGTEIYGKKATIDTTILGHQIDDNSPACSECHSDQTRTYKTFRDKSMSAAHAPTAGTP